MTRAERDVARAQQDGEVVEDVGGLLGDALVRLARRGARDLVGLLAHLGPDQLRVVEQLDRVRAVGPLALPVGEGALERRERLVRAGTGSRSGGRRVRRHPVSRGRSTSARRCGTPGPVGSTRATTRVGVAVVAELPQAQHVARGLSLAPDLLARPAPEMDLAGLERERERLVAHVGQRQHLAAFASPARRTAPGRARRSELPAPRASEECRTRPGGGRHIVQLGMPDLLICRDRRPGIAALPARGAADAGALAGRPHPAGLLRDRVPGDGAVPRGPLAANRRPDLPGARAALVEGDADPVRGRRRDRHDPLVRARPAVAAVHGAVGRGLRLRVRAGGRLVLHRGDLHRDLRLRLGSALASRPPDVGHPDRDRGLHGRHLRDRGQRVDEQPDRLRPHRRGRGDERPARSRLSSTTTSGTS